MKAIKIQPSYGFHVLAKTKNSEAATMVIAAGEKTGGPTNKHDADQWLYVLAGSGEAIVESKKFELNPGILLEIEAGEGHEIRNTGNTALSTLNFYAPPPY